MTRPRSTNRPLAVVALLLSLFMAALEATVVSTAMPTVVGDLGGIDRYAWVFTAYLLSSTITVPINGKLADLYGRKPIMLAGIALFLLGSAASGAAHTMMQLIVWRTVQGLGAGAVQPMALTIVGDIFDVEERARMQGLFGAVWGVAGLAGPLVGGLIVQHLSWRWVFYINVPFGIASALLLVYALHENVEKKKHSLDIAGAALLTAAVIALLVVAQGGRPSLFAVPIAALLLAAFFAVERRAKEPVLPLDVFGRPVILVSSIAGTLVGAAMISTITYVPLFVQGVLGGDPTDAGSAITPMVIGWPVASAIGGRFLTRTGYRPPIRGGLLVTAIAAVALAVLAGPHSSLGLPRLTTCFFGVGLGFANTALIIAVQSAVPWEQRGIVTASTMFFRTIGGALAVGAMGGVLSSSLDHDPAIPKGAASALLGPEHGKSLSPEVVHHLAGSLQHAVSTMFWIIAALGVISFVTALFFPFVPIDPKVKIEPSVGE